MKVFISWSGETSQSIAKKLFEWLPMTLQSIDPYMSAESIEKGARWSASVADQLQESAAGIVVVTPENVSAPWLHFEAGALSKVIEQTKFAPVLFCVKQTDVAGPLAQFQLTELNKSDFLLLLKSINSSVPSESLDEQRLERMHNALWDKFEASLIEGEQTRSKLLEAVLDEALEAA